MSIENSQWGQFIDIDHENIHNQNLLTQKSHSIKYRTKTPPSILENEIYYDDLVRNYSSEVIPTDYQVIDRNTPSCISNVVKNDFANHPMFLLSSFFYYCTQLFWK